MLFLKIIKKLLFHQIVQNFYFSNKTKNAILQYIKISVLHNIMLF